jgi:hypothetical protein
MRERDVFAAGVKVLRIYRPGLGSGRKACEGGMDIKGLWGTGKGGEEVGGEE